jgi:hypothetical protein
MSTPTTELTRELVRMACSAPSIHNTQPWAWRLVGADTVELHADRKRQLPETDPEGRALVISCGAALHHFIIAAEGFGLVAEARLLPEGTGADLLARIHLEPGELDAAAVKTMEALEDRRTDRSGFTDWEIPEPRVEALAAAATGGGAHTMSITDPGLAAKVKLLVDEARQEEHADPGMVEEQAEWLDHSAEDGVPSSNAYPHHREGVPVAVGRFDHGAVPHGRTADDTTPTNEPRDVLMLVYTSGDDQSAWLAAGQALSSLWIRASREGISLTPETQPIEVGRTRQLLRHVLLDDLGHPQVLVRIGWREFSRPAQSPTPRRPVEDVLLP